MRGAGLLAQLLAQLRQSFSRVTSSVAYIPQVDGLRALAMMMVLAHHVASIYLEDTHLLGTQHLPQDWDKIALRSPLVNWLLHLGIGVPLFCAISGFVLTIPFARNAMKGLPAPSWWLYLLRRLIRMEPPYIVNMTILLLMVLMPWRMGWGYAIGMLHLFGPHYLASLVYLHAQIYGGPSWVNGVAWTLEIELQFYLVLPVLAELFRVRQKALRRAIFAALVLGSAVFAQFGLPALHIARLDFSLLRQLQFFSVGMLLADIHLDPPAAWRRLGPKGGDAMVVASAALLVYVLHWRPQLAYVEPFLVAWFFFAVFRAGWFGRLFSAPVLTMQGTICYTIYLYHFFIVGRLLPFTIRLFPPVHALWFDLTVQLPLLLVPVLAISAVLYMLAERPFVVLSHTIAGRLQTKPTAAGLTTPAGARR
jgi:peptidoglycan/LPS O-acetylase OafA/YrhL